MRNKERKTPIRNSIILTCDWDQGETLMVHRNASMQDCNMIAFHKNGYKHFVIKANRQGQKPVTRVQRLDIETFLDF